MNRNIEGKLWPFSWPALLSCPDTSCASRNGSPDYCSACLSFLHSFFCSLQSSHFLNNFLHDAHIINKWPLSFRYLFPVFLSRGNISSFMLFLVFKHQENFHLRWTWRWRYIFFPFLLYCWPVWASTLLGCVGFLALVTKLRRTCRKICFLPL